ncbi:MAG: hypothetical protein RCG15_05570 [Candidatus Rickettsia vulgarisii]
MNNNGSELQIGGNLSSPVDFKNMTSVLTFNGTNGPYNFNNVVTMLVKVL